MIALSVKTEEGELAEFQVDSEVVKGLYLVHDLEKVIVSSLYVCFKTKEDLERALKGKFVSCNVQYRDSKTDVLVCNVFVQRPPEGF